ncbi:MAG TPA: FHA domain-containing protein, partial [Vicinamibacterales bacterium]|nr:FHA domain-containing protein [Vicinamibacterales bacterium]
SLGTLRWPGQGRKPTPDSWAEACAQLTAEIEQQYVLTFFAPAEEELAGQKLHIVTVGRTETTSNELKIPELAQPLAKTGGGGGGHVLHWVLLIGGIVVGALLVLGFIGFAIANRKPARPMPVPGMVPGMMPGAVPGAPPVAMPGVMPGARPIPMLMIMNGQRTGERMMLRHGFWIGKQQGCDLLIQDGYTSSQHAQIGMDAIGNWRLYDRNSTNGTFVNGQRVTEIQLEHGVVIRIGSTELRFLTQ